MASRQKTFKTIDEQIDTLKEKGLIIDDIDYAKDVLLRENYFFLMGYRHLFIRSERDRTFINGTNFRELYAMFNFDRQIRNIIFKNISKIIFVRVPLSNKINQLKLRMVLK